MLYYEGIQAGTSVIPLSTWVNLTTMVCVLVWGEEGEEAGMVPLPASLLGQIE